MVRAPSRKHPMPQVLQDLGKAGVAVWLDDLSRPRLQSGSLVAMAAHVPPVQLSVVQVGVLPVTPNVIKVEAVCCLDMRSALVWTG